MPVAPGPRRCEPGALRTAAPGSCAIIASKAVAVWRPFTGSPGGRGRSGQAAFIAAGQLSCTQPREATAQRPSPDSASLWSAPLSGSWKIGTCPCRLPASGSVPAS